MSYGPGERVRVAARRHDGHHRTPDYVKGKTGTVQRVHSSFTNPETGRLTVGWDSFNYDTTRQWLDGHFVFDEYDATGAVVSTRRVSLRLRWVYQYEMQHLFERAGFAIEALYGDFARNPFKAGGEQVWIARRVGA